MGTYLIGMLLVAVLGFMIFAAIDKASSLAKFTRRRTKGLMKLYVWLYFIFAVLFAQDVASFVMALVGSSLGFGAYMRWMDTRPPESNAMSGRANPPTVTVVRPYRIKRTPIGPEDDDNWGR